MSIITTSDKPEFSVRLHGDRMATVLAHYSDELCRENDNTCESCVNGHSRLPFTECKRLTNSDDMALDIQCCTNCSMLGPTEELDWSSESAAFDFIHILNCTGSSTPCIPIIDDSNAVEAETTDKRFRERWSPSTSVAWEAGFDGVAEMHEDAHESPDRSDRYPPTIPPSTPRRKRYVEDQPPPIARWEAESVDIDTAPVTADGRPMTPRRHLAGRKRRH